MLINATYQCQSVMPISAMSVPPISAAYLCPSVLPISAIYECY
ncbi:unnamed protein product, partial [Staurois parvus]